MTPRGHVLLVEDDVPVRRALADALTGGGFHVTQAENGVRALAVLGAADASSMPDVILSDVRMPDMDGLQLLAVLRERQIEIDSVMMTAFNDMETVVEAVKNGAREFLVKPVDLDELVPVLDRVLADRALRRKPRRPAAAATTTGVLIGRDARMVEVYKLVAQAAMSRATVLVRGESGTGKELVARAIHAHGVGRAQPFVPVNCAALPASLLESELFGHSRGAFTGAVSARRGRFAIAGTGTIFLDEIGDTSLDFQTKLLRVLQDREFQPVGSDETEHTEARVIAATHQNLEAMVVSKRFREDLYYRLRVVDIFIPPLRDRRLDIPVIAEHVLQQAALTLNAPVTVLAPDASLKLLAYQWPGNVRELENCLMRAVIISAGGVIRAADISLSSPSAGPEEAAVSLRELESAHLARTMSMTGGHKGRAAQMLDIPRARLNRLLQKYGLE